MEGQLQTSVAARVADDGILEEVSEGSASAEDVADGMAARLAHDRRNPSYEWATEPRGDEMERRQGWTQAQHEEALGRENEMDRHRQKSHLADEHEVDRAAKSRVDVRETFQHTPENKAAKQDLPEVDCRERLTQEELAEVNQQAAKAAEYFGRETGMKQWSYAKLIARRVTSGMSPSMAMLDLKESIEKELPWVKQDLQDVDPYQYQTTVEGEIVQLWDPNSSSQRQVGLISDGTRSPVKMVVWRNSGDKPTLHIGDEVRLERVKVNEYEEDPTLAVTGDTEVVHHKRNREGDAPRTKRFSGKPDYPSWSTESRDHAWIKDIDMENAIPQTKLETAKSRVELLEEIRQIKVEE